MGCRVKSEGKNSILKGNELPVRQITQFFHLILSNPKNCCIFAVEIDEK